MQTRMNFDLTSKIIALGLAIVTITVFTESVTDPVNVTKLFVLGGFAFAALGSISIKGAPQVMKESKIQLIALAAFALVSILVLATSQAPKSQSLYGIYGRNNGFLLYLFLLFLFLATLTISNQNGFRPILFALLVAGSVNVAYALWVLAFGDFIGWSNPYGNLLGTFGNPNFIGSFFGIFSGLLFAVLLSKTTRRLYRFIAILILPLVFVGIIDTKAVQGKVLFVAAAGVTLFYFVRSHFKSNAWSIGYIFASVTAFLFSLLGTLQIGPLATFLYKETVSLRGQYWFAGWNTGSANPWFGVGFDSYGDWYRRSRRESALTLPGVDTVTNTAHNVYMDMFSFGGWPLLISYSAITITVLVAVIRHTLRNKQFDVVFASLVSVWICYQLQSIISINQVGLAVWGWVSSAALIAYERNNRGKILPTDEKVGRNAVQAKKSNQAPIFSRGLASGLSALVGLLVAVPPLSADMKWREAQVSQDVDKVIATLQSSYMNPLNSFKINNVVGVLETNGFQDLALEYALKAVDFNPDSYVSWRTISLITKSSEEQKTLAFDNMRRLDPLNTTIGKVTE